MIFMQVFGNFTKFVFARFERELPLLFLNPVPRIDDCMYNGSHRSLLRTN
jgi:hypothetical protein